MHTNSLSCARHIHPKHIISKHACMHAIRCMRIHHLKPFAKCRLRCTYTPMMAVYVHTHQKRGSVRTPEERQCTCIWRNALRIHLEECGVCTAEERQSTYTSNVAVYIHLKPFSATPTPQAPAFRFRLLSVTVAAPNAAHISTKQANKQHKYEYTSQVYVHLTATQKRICTHLQNFEFLWRAEVPAKLQNEKRRKRK